MGFGATVAHGPGIEPLPLDLMGSLVEVRVESDLSKPAKFALRFEDDVCNGSWSVSGSPILVAGTLITIVTLDPARACLVHGPITKIVATPQFGAAGSTIEVHGEDRRVEMDRVEVQAAWHGKESAAATALLGHYGFTPDVQETLISYEKPKRTRAQRATDLKFLEDIARRNNMEFWIDYEVRPGPAISIEQTARIRTSPPREQSLSDGPRLTSLGDSLGDGVPTIELNPPRGACANVSAFSVEIDHERPVSVKATAGAEVGESSGKASIPEDPDLLESIAGVSRRVHRPNAKDRTKLTRAVAKSEAFLEAEMTAYEQSWLVSAECSATVEQLTWQPRPHQIVRVNHVDERLPPVFQVAATTDVINAADHYVDFTLRANALGTGGRP